MIFSVCTDFAVDMTYMTGQPWSVKASDFEARRREIGRAAAAVQRIRSAGEGPREGESVLFPRLPYILEEQRLMGAEEQAQMRRLAAVARGGGLDAVISVGIGGSYLGNQVLFDACCGPYWNMETAEERRHLPKVFFAGQTADPETLESLLRFLRRDVKQKEGPYRVLVLAISKSGTTIEPMGALSVLEEALPRIGCETRFAAVTDREKGSLHDHGREKGWTLFSVPEGIGGRFSVFSQVGLVFAALCGIDIREFLRGARETETACRSLRCEENPALFMAAAKYIASKDYGIAAEITMPYADRLRSLSWWYAQLLGESLGKKADTEGRVVHAGRIPVSAVGTTDMHSLTQEQQEGQRNKLLQFISVKRAAPALTFHLQEKGKPCAVPMSYVMEAALHANAVALAGEQRMSCELILGGMNPFCIGALMYFFFLTIAYEGAMWGIDAYDQPGVEAYKKILHQDLAGFCT